MELLRVQAEEYKEMITAHTHVFNTVEFAELNKDKCDSLHYLIFRNKKLRFGLILGERNHELYSPFSAPFGGYDFFRLESVEFIDEAVSLLSNYGNNQAMKIHITLPPTIYGESYVSKAVSALYRSGFSIENLDMNFQYELCRFKNYGEYIARMAQKNLNNSMRLNLSFIKLDSEIADDVARAYAVIKNNREARGFPLRMTKQAVLDTIKILKADFFIMSYEGVDVAAAQVYQVTPEIYQVIYWGNIVEYSYLRVMNYFSYKVTEYYYNQGARILDIGPSTEHSVPNYGLCDFKESIGCTVSLKYSFCK